MSDPTLPSSDTPIKKTFRGAKHRMKGKVFAKKCFIKPWTKKRLDDLMNKRLNFNQIKMKRTIEKMEKVKKRFEMWTLKTEKTVGKLRKLTDSNEQIRLFLNDIDEGKIPVATELNVCFKRSKKLFKREAETLSSSAPTTSSENPQPSKQNVSRNLRKSADSGDQAVKNALRGMAYEGLRASDKRVINELNVIGNAVNRMGEANTIITNASDSMLRIVNANKLLFGLMNNPRGLRPAAKQPTSSNEPDDEISDEDQEEEDVEEGQEEETLAGDTATVDPQPLEHLDSDSSTSTAEPPVESQPAVPTSSGTQLQNIVEVDDTMISAGREESVAKQPQPSQNTESRIEKSGQSSGNLPEIALTTETREDPADSDSSTSSPSGESSSSQSSAPTQGTGTGVVNPGFAESSEDEKSSDQPQPQPQPAEDVDTEGESSGQANPNVPENREEEGGAARPVTEAVQHQLNRMIMGRLKIFFITVFTKRKTFWDGEFNSLKVIANAIKVQKPWGRDDVKVMSAFMKKRKETGIPAVIALYTAIGAIIVESPQERDCAQRTLKIISDKQGNLNAVKSFEKRFLSEIEGCATIFLFCFTKEYIDYRVQYDSDPIVSKFNPCYEWRGPLQNIEMIDNCPNYLNSRVVREGKYRHTIAGPGTQHKPIFAVYYEFLIREWGQCRIFDKDFYLIEKALEAEPDKPIIYFENLLFGAIFVQSVP